MTYFTYILECADGTLYVGVTTDVQRRIEEHNTSDKGAKYTKARRPVLLKYAEECANRSEASLKKLTRIQKLSLVKNSAKV